jgi:hypothetical protein
MKNRNLFFALAAGVLLLTGCRKEGEKDSPEVLVKFSSTIQAAQSRPSGTAWNAGDAIGVFMVKSGSVTVAEEALNKKYTVGNAGETGFFVPASPVDNNAVHYPSDGSPVDFIAYAPYRQDVAALSCPVDVSGQSSPAAIDLLYATTAEGYSRATADPALLRFAHQLARLELNITAGEGVSASSLADLSVVIKGMNTAATFNLADGTLSNAGTVADVVLRTVSAGQIYDAVVLPQTLAAGAVGIEFIAASGGYREYWEVPAGVFAKNTEYRYDIVLGRSGISSVTCSIRDWELSSTDHPSIPLISPDDGVLLDLSDAGELSFAWTAVAGVSDYWLALSLSPDMSSPQEIPATGNPFALSVDDLNVVFADLGLTGAVNNTPVYWTVRPASSGTQAEKEVRYINVVRAPVIELGSPANATLINANGVIGGARSFTWTPGNDPSLTGYTLKISTSDQFPDDASTLSFSIPDADADHYDLPDAVCDGLLASLNVEPASRTAAPLYWTVEPAGTNSIRAQVRSFDALRKGAELVKTSWTAVSTVGNDASNPYTNLIDGDPDTYWYPAAAVWNGWVVLDMQDEKTITYIDLYMSHHIKNLTIGASNDGTLNSFNWPGTNPECILGTISRPQDYSTAHFSIVPPVPVRARYLYIRMNDSWQYGYLQLRELSVKGSETVLP